MQAIIHSRYGPPDALELQDIETPSVTTGAIKWGDANSAFAQLRRLSGHTLWPSP